MAEQILDLKKENAGTQKLYFSCRPFFKMT